jgi:hypothetical protein
MKKISSLEERPNAGGTTRPAPHAGQPSVAIPPGMPLRCAMCRSDQHLVLHSIDPLPAGRGEPLVHVVYACTACGSLHAHAASFRDVAALLNEADTVPGMLKFGNFYLHCGKPMATTGAVRRTMTAPLSSSGTGETCLPDVLLTTKTLRCICGFSIELPD